MASSAVMGSKSEFPHRDDQITPLFDLVYENAGEMVHVFGYPGTGKTSIVKWIVDFRKENQEPVIYINCHECSSTRSVFERILRELSQLEAPVGTVVGRKIRQTQANKRKTTNRHLKEVYSFECKNGDQFVQHFTLLCKKRFGTCSIVCVLDNVERVRYYEDDDPFPILCRLSDYTDASRLVIVTISELPWQKLFPDGRLNYVYAPIQIAFPNYSSEQIVDVLAAMRRRYDESSINDYRIFAGLIANYFRLSCRDVLELDYHTRNIWEQYRMAKPDRGSTTRQNGRDISKEIVNLAAQGEKGLFLRNSTAPCEMPKQRKYLFVAAFFASYNPKKSDCRFFLKHRDKAKLRTRTRKQTKSSIFRQQLLKGPNAFPLERLLTIYRLLAKNDDQMVEADGVCVTNRLLMHISTLASDNLLQSLNQRTLLGTPTYRCLASLELGEEVAKSIGVELKRHLVDFVDAA